MRGSALVGLACATSACIDLAPYVGPGGSEPLTPLTVTGDPDTEAVEVEGAHFLVRFAGPMPSPDGARYPDLITLDGAPVLGEHDDCNGGDRLGIAVDPAFTLNSRWPEDTNTVTPVEVQVSGPAHAQLLVAWTYGYTCDLISTQAAGSSRFSFFPDGRVIRADLAQPSDSGPLATGGAVPCGCATVSPAEYWVTSFLALRNSAFRRYRFARLTTPGESEEAALPVIPGPDELDTSQLWVTDPNPIWGCIGPDASDPGPYVGVVWTTPSAEEDNGTRIWPVYGTSEPNTVFVWDWLYAKTGSTAVPGSMTYQANTALFLGTGPASQCDYETMSARDAGYNNSPELVMTPEATAATAVGLSRSDGIYHYMPTPTPTMAPASYEIRTERQVPRGFALSVLLPTVDAPVIRRDGTLLRDGADYLGQARAEPTTVYFRHTLWFRADLDIAQSLTIGSS